MAFLSPGTSFSHDKPSLNLLSDQDIVLAQGTVSRGLDGLPRTVPEALPTVYSTSPSFQATTTVVERPGAGTRVEIAPGPGQVYRLAFEADAARLALQGGDLVLQFQDGAELIFQDYANLADRGAAPLLEVDGVTIGGNFLLEQIALAIDAAGQDARPTLETAAAAPQGGGGSRYLDDLGDPLTLLSPEGPIPFTALAFGLLSTDLRLPEEFILAALAGSSGPPTGLLSVNPDGVSPSGAEPGSEILFAGALAEDTPAPATLSATVGDPNGDEVITRIEVSNLPTATDGWSLDLSALQADVTNLGGTLDLSGFDQGNIVIRFDSAAGIRAFSSTIVLRAPTNSDLDHFGVNVLVTAENLLTGATATGGTENIAIPVDAIVDGTEVLLGGSVIGPNSVVTGNRGAVTALGLTITDLQDQTSLAGTQSDADAPYTQGGGDSDGSETVTRIEVTLSPGDASTGLPILGFDLPEGVQVEQSATGSSVTTVFSIEPGTSITTVNALVQSLTVSHPDPDFAGDIAVDITTRTEETALIDGEVTDTNNVDLDSYGFTLRFSDPGPTASPDQATVTDALDLNLTFVIDHSSSMGEDSGVSVQSLTLPEGISDPVAFENDPNNVLANGNLTRLGLLKVALVELLDTYGAGGTEVNILLIQFDEVAETLGSGWIEDDLGAAIDLILGIEVGFGTNYTDAVEEAMSSYPAGTPEADQNILYFLSDGEPTRGGGNPPNTDNSIPDATVAAWEDFLSEHLMKSIAVGIGEGVDAADSDLEDVAAPNQPNDDNPLIVLDEAGLISTLVDTVDNRVTGNVLENDDFGGDGAGTPRIVDLTVDGTRFVFEGDRVVNQSNGNVTLGTVLTATTLLGGTLIFDFATGEFGYTAPQVVGSGSEAFTYTIQDQDGDLSSADLTISILDQDLPASANDDRVLTNSQSIEIADAWLVRNDEDPQGDVLGVAEVRNAVGGDAEGSFVDPAVSFEFDQNQASFEYLAHDFVQTSNPATVELSYQAGVMLAGSDGDEIVIGSSGSDTIDGNDGDDVVAGGGGGDLVKGGDGDDLIVGGEDSDTLAGNDGDDRFAYRPQDAASGVDTILDFHFDEDVIDLAELLDGFDAGDDIGDFVELSILDNQILVDADGLEGGSTFDLIAFVAGNGVNAGDVLTVITDFEGNSVTVDAS